MEHLKDFQVQKYLDYANNILKNSQHRELQLCFNYECYVNISKIIHIRGLNHTITVVFMLYYNLKKILVFMFIQLVLHFYRGRMVITIISASVIGVILICWKSLTRPG